ncbi:uncharacterized protein TRIADDRAFT_51558 [Trichoplax adhaerens]|uniref:non-specific serine/threonine protein kinase n=1 Tax=Trichoplax adhaerens TaxID=10228 RepID=B3RJR4_TRIAD|nr:hypothetical protein TRIADDRAFT_51558 [Trichoplax adhaerens]EDV28545.1 hypothetical protein TRIADDRAFT_51558 [Trichoplax adhaerens]|eukprot:XP_002107747.1 hypothetical protein TRIADDRAFT_51558 [Trichoplax adhaerens]
MGGICSCRKNEEQLLRAESYLGNPNLEIQAEDIKMATNNFSAENRIGAGAFGEVYQADLHSFGVVAVKRIKQKFLHTGLVVDGHFCMVMEFMINGSLRSRLQAKDENLNYLVRLRICRGIANGINYLHSAFRTYLVHRDIKSDNVLLSEDYTPKICDFGLVKIFSSKRNNNVNSAAMTENICGTQAYLPPEAFDGIISRRLDVYSYGTVLLEIISGKSPLFSNKEGIPYLANWPKDYTKELMKLANWCLRHKYEDRPYMKEVSRETIQAVQIASEVWQLIKYCVINDLLLSSN